MRRIYSSLQRVGKRAYATVSVFRGRRRLEHFRLKHGLFVFVEGGPLSGKTKFLEDLRERLLKAGKTVLFVGGTEPVTRWLSEIAPPVPMSAQKALSWRLSNLPEGFFLLADNADRITDGRKLEVFLELLDRARTVVVAGRSFSSLHPRLQARLREAKVVSLGCGADTFDATYVLVAVLIIVVALSGYHHLVLLAAAMRYLFQGIRIGGRRI
ncbi:MAG: hypothetical protein DSZ24_06765 [Thermodesulfatator sp.]|nr:MAG: hypothetical protein DSZ24_06765 [Thermodesulfatator sp.]